MEEKTKKMSSKSKTEKKDRQRAKEFSLKLENSKILKRIIEALSSIIDETAIKVDPTGFLIEAMDPSKICLLKLTIKKVDFDEFECSKECKIVVNLDDFDKILKRSTTNDSIEINYKEEDQKIKIKMKREGSSRTRTFSLATHDTDVEEVTSLDSLLNIEYEVRWNMDPDFLIEALKDAEIYSEILNIKAIEDQGLIFNSSGQIGEMTYEIDRYELNSANIDNEASGVYSILFLKAILKLATITKDLEISLKTDHPLKMNFTLLEGGELLYFLAPRVEENDSDEFTDYEEV